jgi:hypothetical protein
MHRALVIPILLVVSTPALADERARAYAGVSVEELYDSNVMNSRGPDSVTRVTPRVGARLDSERFDFGVDYRVGLHLYAAGTADNSINHRAAAYGKERLTRRFELTQQMVLTIGDDPVLLDRVGVSIPEGGFVDFVGTAGFLWRAMRRLHFDGTYMFRSSRFDLAQGPNPLAFDGDEHRFDLDAGYELSRRLNLHTVGRYQHFVAYGSPQGGSLGDAVGGGAGLVFRIAPTWTASAVGGPLAFLGEGLTWFARGDITNVGPRSRLSLIALHDLYGGTGASEAIWESSIVLDGSYHLMRRVVVRGRFGGYVAGPAPDQDANVSGLLAHAEIGLLLFGRNARLDVYGEHRAQGDHGSLTFGDIQRTVVGIRLSASVGLDQLTLGEVP